MPGNVIRVVNIEDVDVEACCGTHCDNTSEVGWIKLIKTSRISDGTLRLEYVANQKVFKALNDETTVINNLKEMWGINQAEIVPTARRFFEDYKRYEKETQSQKMNLLTMHVRYMIESKLDTFIVPSLEKELTLYFSNMKTNLIPLVVPRCLFRKTRRLWSSLMTCSSSELSQSLTSLVWRTSRPNSTTNKAPKSLIRSS